MSVSGHSGVALPVGIPPGGGTGEQLTKQSPADFDVDWDPSGGAGSGAPNDAEYLVSSLNGGLTAERLVLDTDSVKFDFTTPAAAQANYVPDFAQTLIAAQVFGG